MAGEIEIGDVVFLKSGSPAMTVTSVGEAHMTGKMTVWCSWFDHKMSPQTGTFPLAAVKKEDE